MHAKRHASSFINSLARAHTHSFIRHRHSPNHTTIDTHNNSFSNFLTYSSIHLQIEWFTHTLTHSPTHSLKWLVEWLTEFITQYCTLANLSRTHTASFTTWLTHYSFIKWLTRHLIPSTKWLKPTTSSTDLLAIIYQVLTLQLTNQVTHSSTKWVTNKLIKYLTCQLIHQVSYQFIYWLNNSLTNLPSDWLISSFIKRLSLQLIFKVSNSFTN